ncbi:histidine phosphatase family protein [Nocardia terpenica]|uniref:histidine phosphatase family protein n=1 Tax=Nocardia terpenica TaxID=455432 RepID=UPI001EEB9BD7|nr:histidine phosphatase family protein [Nocardia terpenica]
MHNVDDGQGNVAVDSDQTLDTLAAELLPGTAVVGLEWSLAQVWAVRHGQSTANVAFARADSDSMPIRGRDRDVVLSPRGVSQAAALGRWWSGLAVEQRPQLVVCSPYARARQTWTVMSDTADTASVPLVIDERARDREMGVFELWPPPVIHARAPEEFTRWELVGEWGYRPPGGESLADVALRVRSLVLDLDRVAAGQRVLLVAHDAVVTAVSYVLAGLGAPVPDRVPPVPNASVSLWARTSEGLRPRLWGNTDHLRDLGIEHPLPEQD